jgi:hypothetical protein
MEEDPRVPQEEESLEQTPQRASDFQRSSFIEEFIRVYEELLLSERAFFGRLAPSGFLLDAALFFYVTLVIFQAIHSLVSRPQIPLSALLSNIALGPVLLLIPFCILAFLLYFIPQRHLFGVGSLGVILKGVLYSASKLFVLILPMDAGLALLGIQKDPKLLALVPLSPAGYFMQLAQMAYYVLVLVAFFGTLHGLLRSLHGLSSKRASLALAVCFGALLIILVGLKALQQT